MKNMLRVFVIATIAIRAVFAYGLFVTEVKLTPEEREAQERAVREWPKIIQSRYDFASLSSFLKKTVAEKKSWQSVDLTKPAIGDKWTVVLDSIVGEFGGMIMTSGDWKFFISDPKEDTFTLTFFSDKEDLSLSLHCIRKSKDNFKLVEITSFKPFVINSQAGEKSSK